VYCHRVTTQLQLTNITYTRISEISTFPKAQEMKQTLIAQYKTGAFLVAFVDSCTDYRDLKPERI